MPQPPACQSRRPSAGGGIHRRQPPAGLGRLGPQRDYAHWIVRREWKFTMGMVLHPTLSKSWKGFSVERCLPAPDGLLVGGYIYVSIAIERSIHCYWLQKNDQSRTYIDIRMQT